MIITEYTAYHATDLKSRAIQVKQEEVTVQAMMRIHFIVARMNKTVEEYVGCTCHNIFRFNFPSHVR